MTAQPDFLQPRHSALYAYFAQSAETYPDNPCLHVPSICRVPAQEGDDLRSYAQVSTQVDALANALEAAGYGRGHRIAAALDNSADLFVHFLAFNKIGVSLVPLNAAMSVDELSYLISHSDSALVVTKTHHETHLGAAAQAADIPLCLAGDALPAAPAPVADVWPEGLEAEAAILFTSGTTGKPKACIYTNEYIVMVAEHYNAMGGYCALEPGRERLITPLPVNHMNALACSFPVMMLTGGCLIQLDRFSPKTWWPLVRETKATCLHYLGVMPAMLLNMEAGKEDDFSSQIKFGFGAGVDPKHQLNFEKRFGFPLIEAWAMTETGAGGWTSNEKEPRHPGMRCIGLPRAHMEIKLVDEAGNQVPSGEPGELLVRTKGENPRKYFFKEYYKDPEATQEAWAGGWFHTGDVVRQDQEGFYYFVDRNKNIVRRSGENIAAVEVESVIAAQPGIANLAVCPVPDDIRGEEVCALLVLGDGLQGDEALALTIQNAVTQALVYFKAPGYVGFVDDLPQTASNKLARGQVKVLARELLENGQLFDLRQHKRGSRRAP
jgi:acyl-coenzyme A synthetase/AMP-(fatty) acid ligase